MGLHKHGGTMDGGLTPICNECGVSLCWDLAESEALENKDFWDQWKCQVCNDGEPMSLAAWKAAKASPSTPSSSSKRPLGSVQSKLRSGLFGRSKMVEKMTFFFGAEDPFSHWHPSEFTVNGVRFANGEQFMMFCKASLFGDKEVAAKILKETDPRKDKALGRLVRGFQESLWIEKREVYVRKGNHAKFSQNPHLLQALLATDGTELVEASPYDKIWGVGLAANNPDIHDKSKWLGLNLLGKCLMHVRAQLLEEQLQHNESPGRGGLILRKALEADHPESQIELMQRFDVSTLSQKVDIERKVEQAPTPLTKSVLYPLFERKKSAKKTAGPSM